MTVRTWTAVLAMGLLAAGCAKSPRSQAFEAARAAVKAAPGAPSGADVQSLDLHARTGLKGSRAQVVCGQAVDPRSGAPTPFIYVWTLQPAAPDPGIKAGQLILMTGAIDRRAANRVDLFCTGDGAATPTPYDYFE